MGARPSASGRPKLGGSRTPNGSIAGGQRDTVSAGCSDDESIGGIAVKSRGQSIYRDHDVSIERQKRQNPRFGCAGQPLRERKGQFQPLFGVQELRLP